MESDTCLIILGVKHHKYYRTPEGRSSNHYGDALSAAIGFFLTPQNQ